MDLQIKKALRKAACATPIAVLVMIASQGAARADPCDPFQDVPVNMTRIFDEPAYIDTENLAFIQSLVSDTRHSIHENITLGVTRYEPTLEFRLSVETTQAPDGTACAHIAKADVTVGYRDVKVYIAHEIPEGSCGYGEIMRHEQKHIAVNERLLDDYMPLIKGRLAEYLKLNGLFREPTPDYALHLLETNVQAMLKDLGDELLKDNRTRQQAVDTREEYERITLSCNGELSRIVDKSGLHRR